MRYRIVPVLILAALVAQALGQHAFFMPAEQFARFRNRRGPKGEGSCVQASIAAAGAHHGMPEAEWLLEPSAYGPPELDGSWPDRTARYAATRRMPIWNIEGAQTLQWIEWALRRGCYVSITYGAAHMINAVGISPDGQTVYLWDNNVPTEIRPVPIEVFVREHRSYGGGWAVILQTVAPPPWQTARPAPMP